MGEAKRKRTLQGLAAGLEEIRAEGQGVWQISIYGLDAMPALLHNSLCGDPHATSTLQALAHMIAGIETAPARRPILCLTCDNALTAHARPMAFVILHARRDDPKQCVGNGICAECYARTPSAAALGPVVTAYYRRKVISDLRVLPPISEPGTA